MARPSVYSIWEAADALVGRCERLALRCGVTAAMAHDLERAVVMMEDRRAILEREQDGPRLTSAAPRRA